MFSNSDKFRKIGTPVAKSKDTVHYAEVDGIVEVVGNCPSAGYFNGFTDGNADPLTLKAAAYGGGSTYNMGFCMLVKKGKNYKVTDVGGAVVTNIYFTPLELGFVE